MLRYFIGAVAGGLFGYFVFYRLIGCSTGSCATTSNPYISTLLGVVLGVFFVASIAPSANKDVDGAKQTPEAVYRKISAEEAKARIDSGDDVIIVDVRTEAEYNAEHIPGAILIPNETIKEERPEQLPDLDAEILIYCRSGNRSAQAAKKLVKMGYTNVYDFGGINKWPYEKVKN